MVKKRSIAVRGKKKKPMAKRIPLGVQIISVLFYINAVFSLIVGLLFFVGSTFVATLAGKIPVLATLGTGFFVFIGFVFIALAILDFFIGKGLWKAQQWARIVAIIILIIGFVGSLFPFKIVGLIISGIIGGYLLFSKKVQSFFS